MSGAILVAGATGNVGQHVVRKLLAANRSTVALVRDIDQAQKVLGTHVKFAVGDVSRPETLRPALQDVRCIVCTIGARFAQGDTAEQIDYAGVKNLVEAAQAAQINQFVLVSSIAATRPDHPLNRFGQVLTWKFKSEEVLRSSGLAYTIVRPGGLIDEPGGQAGVQIDQGDRMTGRISRADVAEVCIQAMNQPSALNMTFEIIQSNDAPPGDWAAFFSKLRKDQ